MCTTANPPGGVRCFRCDADLAAPAPLLPVLGRRHARNRQSSFARFFLGDPALSRRDRLGRRLFRGLILITLVLLLPAALRPFGYGIEVPVTMGGLEPGERVWISRNVEKVAVGDLVTVNSGGLFSTQFGEVLGIDPATGFYQVRSGGLVLPVEKWRLQGRAVFVYRPLNQIRRIPSNRSPA